MDFGKTLTNPWVLGGGALIGVIILMTAKGGTSNATTDAGPSSAVLAYNSHALDAVAAQYHDTVDLAKLNVSANVSSKLATLDYLKSIDETRSVVRGKMIDAQAGIVQSQIAGNTAIIVDQDNNRTRLQQSYVEATVSAHTDNTNVQIAQIQASAAKKMAKWGALGSAIGTIGTAALLF